MKKTPVKNKVKKIVKKRSTTQQIPKDPAILRIEKKCRAAMQELKLYTWRRKVNITHENTYAKELVYHKHNH